MAGLALAVAPANSEHTGKQAGCGKCRDPDGDGPAEQNEGDQPESGGAEGQRKQ